MTAVFVTALGPTAVEVSAVAGRASEAGVGIRIGPGLIARFGAPLVGSVRTVEVFADARLSGAPEEVVAGARGLALAGAGFISIDARTDVDALDRAAGAIEPYRSRLVAVGIPPGAPEPSSGRGKAVSAAARHLAPSVVELVLGEAADIGVVAQVAPSLRVVVTGVGSTEAAAEAVRRGAAGIVAEPDTDLASLASVIGPADTIDSGGQ